ncbi:MAG: xylulokinase [Eubacteriales bacterium]|nr:xylulokinase [Eubacteriales bacterium]
MVGIDLGTSSVKALICDYLGNVAGVGSAGYEIETPHIGWAEQEPNCWWTSTRAAIAQALLNAKVDASSIRGIGLSGQMHGVVAMDRECLPLGKAIIWMDQRSVEERDELRQAAGALIEQELLNQPSSGMMICTLLWLRKHRPEVYEQIATVLLPKDYIRYRLTGVLSAEPSDASATLAFSVVKREWCRELIQRLGLKTDIWPTLLESCSIAGTLTHAASEATGLPAGIPVASGGGDSSIQILGNGVLGNGTMSCNIGTASQYATMADSPVFDPQMRCQTWCSPDTTKWLVQGGTLNGGSALRWFRERVLRTDRPFAELSDEASLIPAGSEGLVFIPYLAGERTPFNDPLARGVFFGLSMKHGQAHMTRSIMEGVLYNLRECRDVFDSIGLTSRRVIASGGAAKSPLWRQIMADVLNSPIYTTNTREEACLGAAITALVGLQVYGSIQEACEAVVHTSPDATLPIPENVTVFNDRFSVFHELYQRVQNLYPRLSE